MFVRLQCRTHEGATRVPRAQCHLGAKIRDISPEYDSKSDIPPSVRPRKARPFDGMHPGTFRTCPCICEKFGRLRVFVLSRRDGLRACLWDGAPHSRNRRQSSTLSGIVHRARTTVPSHGRRRHTHSARAVPPGDRNHCHFARTRPKIAHTSISPPTLAASARQRALRNVSRQPCQLRADPPTLTFRPMAARRPRPSSTSLAPPNEPRPPPATVAGPVRGGRTTSPPRARRRGTRPARGITNGRQKALPEQSGAGTHRSVCDPRLRARPPCVRDASV